ncbi:sigma-54-dependent Fis family transcriptional regulator [Lachnoclostridium phytofermentans]|uniref:sigma-54-dependent Fis family transcriptional regulator n=1 Tax=Lachnoclostridium phytofermentans TaxID=66219 RepID=UPI000495F955|nr:sigma-54-dependent Fis family transcriptional regulator [Lachnoclostridium phytofermentans]
MAGIALLMPTKQLYEQAKKIVNTVKCDVKMIEYVTIENVIDKTKEAIDKGVNIIISRGRQAEEIKLSTNIPVVEMVFTAQELGLIIVKAKRLVAKARPKVGVIAFQGMLCDMTYFKELYDVDIKLYLQDLTSNISESVANAIKDGVDVIIGGESTMIYANQQNFPALVLESTGESIKTALKTAENMYHMLDMEQHNFAIFSTILDSSFNGIMRTDTHTTILAANRVIQQIVGKDSSEILGHKLRDILNGLDESLIEQVISGQTQSYYTFLNVSQEPLAIVIESIVVDGEVTGMIVSCNRVHRLGIRPEKELKEQFLQGYVARETLDSMQKESPGLKNIIKIAKLYAQSNSPILIEQASGVEAERLCEGIHNYSLRKGGPFVLINLAGLEQEDQHRLLFGGLDIRDSTKAPGALMKAKYGTLVVMGADKLTKQSQYYLSCIIQKKIVKNYDFAYNEIKSQFIDVRLIFCTSKDMAELITIDKMRKDFYYQICALSFKIPTINERAKDRELLLETYFAKYQKQYSHFHILSQGAKEVLLKYHWEGGAVQLESLMERLILTIGKRIISEEDVRNLLDFVYANKEIVKEVESGITEPSVERKQDEEDLIKSTLKRYAHNRSLTAKSLGMSKTTLWRKMKKYGID